MDNTLEEVKDITSDCCVTIIIKTHRSFPQNEKDPIELKNAIQEAEQRLLSEYDKQLAQNIIKRIHDLADNIDFNHNLECLTLFVDEKIAKFVRLPVKVENRVIIDTTFETRELKRAMQREMQYYVLVLSRFKARLLKALNHTLTKEFRENFPITNTFKVASEGVDAELPIGMDSLTRQYFISVDEQLNEIEKQEKLPVVVCTDESNYSEYLHIAKRKELIEGHLNGSRDDEDAQNIISEVWPIAKKIRDDKNQKRLSEISAAISAANLVTGLHNIWKAITERRGGTLFVKQGYFQAGKVKDNGIEVVSSDTNDRENVEDIIDLMIEKTVEFGGDVVFVNGDDLNEYDNLALVARY